MPTLAPEEVHIWSARQPSEPSPDLEEALSPEERDRACRFQFVDHRSAFAFAHGVLRDVLSQYLHRPPRDIRFRQNAFGKPSLDETDDGRDAEFNLSHAGRLVVIGLCRGRRIGIDVEEIRPMDDISAIAESYFTSKEHAFIFRQHPKDRDRTFFRCWTRKEAYVKAVGKGLSIPLNSFDTQISGAQRGGLLDNGSGSTHGATWQLSDLELPEGYVGAVAVETGIDRLVCFEWRPRMIKKLDGFP
jgi:4'-phosphopantetheinyl transferase